MLVAGSVLALLLMGLAVDGVVSSADEEMEDETDRTDDDLTNEDDALTDPGAGLAELLFGDDLEADAPQTDDLPPLVDDTVPTILPIPTAEDDGFVDIEEMTTLLDGCDCMYVEDFQTDTDRLVLEFDGAAQDAPEIEIDFEAEDGAALVLANGQPVTLVEGATDLTTDQIDVIMLDDDEATMLPPEGEDLAAQDATEDEAPEAVPERLADAHDGTVQFVSVNAEEIEEQAAAEGIHLIQMPDAAPTPDSDPADTDQALLANADTEEPVANIFAASEATDGNAPQTESNRLIMGFNDLVSGGHGTDTFHFMGETHSAPLNDFNPSQDVIEVVYDPEDSSDPVITVEDFEDGSGANIVMDGNVILSMPGAQGLDPSAIALRASV